MPCGASSVATPTVAEREARISPLGCSLLNSSSAGDVAASAGALRTAGLTDQLAVIAGGQRCEIFGQTSRVDGSTTASQKLPNRHTSVNSYTFQGFFKPYGKIFMI